MKKYIVLLVALAVTSVAVGQDVVGYETFHINGLTGGTARVSARVGTPVCKSLNIKSGIAGDVDVHRASIKATAYEASAASTSIVVIASTTGGGKVGGHLPVAGDELIVVHSGSSGLQNATVAASLTNGVSTNGYFTITTDAALTLTGTDTVYIAKSADKVELSIAGNTATTLEYAFAGFADMPFVVELPATMLTNVVSGLVEWQRHY